jgi:hypothetical protein
MEIFRDRVIFAKVATSLAGDERQRAQDWFSRKSSQIL